MPNDSSDPNKNPLNPNLGTNTSPTDDAQTPSGYPSSGGQTPSFGQQTNTTPSMPASPNPASDIPASTQNPSGVPQSPANENMSDTSVNPVLDPPNTTGGGNSDDPPQAVVSAPHAPEKYGGKKIIATIFGILLLVGAVAAGVTLVQRQQNLQQQAASGSACDQSPDCDLLDNPGNSGSYVASRTIIYADITDQDYHRYNPGDTDDGCRKVSINGNTITWERYGSGPDCKDVSNVQVWLGNLPSATSTPTPEPSVTNTPTLTPTITPTNPPNATNTPTSTLTPTLPPNVSAECSEVIAYDTNWVQLDAQDLSALKTGDKVRFSVKGNASSGSFSKARFSVNGTSIGETTLKKPSSDEFYKEYEIPTGVSNFSVKGEVFHSSLGWI